MNSIRVFILLLGIGLLTGPTFAAEPTGPDAVKARMKANLPAIDRLKKAGKVGENRQAYLEPRGDLSDEEKGLVKIENEDRKSVYTLLARRAKSTIESVQKARAAQIRERSTAGLWLQDPDGSWYRKRPEDVRSPGPAASDDDP